MNYLTLFKKTFALELSSEMAYKWNFFIKSLGLIFADLIGPIIILLIYTYSSGIPGWKFEEFILFQGTFILVNGLAHTLLFGLPFQVIRSVQQGTFDKVLIKPFNPLLYLSFSSIDIEGIAEVLAGLGLIIWAFVKLGIIVFSWNTLLFLFLILLAFVFLYATFVLMSSLAFLFVKSFGLFDLFFKIIDVARYPLSIYEGGMRFVFTFLIPIGIISFYPVNVLLGGLSIMTLLEILIPVLLFLGFSVFMWNRAIRKYTSAGG
ncbi:MAG: ABC-2 family transporter protein [Nanoarchaeota archaeon]|nr:ABC-2 family transporter protein [Nanoarchaeota archaeon]